MSGSVDPLPASERARVLALLGVDRWLLRGSEPCGNDPPTELGTGPGRDLPAEASRPGALPREAVQPAVVAPAAKLAIVCGEPDPLSGRYAALLRHVVRALAVDASLVSWSVAGDAPVLAFGAAPGDAADAVLAPPLATLRASGAARRSLWPQLRRLRRRLREGG